MERELPGGDLFGENCILGEFSRTPIRSFFTCLAFSLLNQFYA